MEEIPESCKRALVHVQFCEECKALLLKQARASIGQIAAAHKSEASREASKINVRKAIAARIAKNKEKKEPDWSKPKSGRWQAPKG